MSAIPRQALVLPDMLFASQSIVVNQPATVLASTHREVAAGECEAVHSIVRFSDAHSTTVSPRDTLWSPGVAEYQAALQFIRELVEEAVPEDRQLTRILATNPWDFV